MQLPQNGALCHHDPPWKCWYCWCNTRKLRTQRCAYVEYEASSLPHQVIQSTTLWLSKSNDLGIRTCSTSVILISHPFRLSLFGSGFLSKKARGAST